MVNSPHFRKEGIMLAVIAAVLFAIAFIINAAAVATSAVFSPISFLLAGLACLALHQAGVGPQWSAPRRRR
jgi:drug/metabolite transporter (DMT)-like permease